MADTIARAVFGLLFETSTDAAFIVDRTTGTVVSANLRAADLLACDVSQLIGTALLDLAFEPERDFSAPGRYEDVGLRRSDHYPVYVELQVAHVETAEYGALAAYMARDKTERQVLERELLANHTALFTAYADLERAHAQLGETKQELETRNAEIAMLAWRAAMGELVAGIAHHLNNPVGALASTTTRLNLLVSKLPMEYRSELERLLARVSQISRRIESNVAAIVSASRSNAFEDVQNRPELPPELARVLAMFAEKMEDIPVTPAAQPPGALPRGGVAMKEQA